VGAKGYLARCPPQASTGGSRSLPDAVLAFRVFGARGAPGGMQQQRVTKGSIEAAVANAVVRFQREQQGRGAAEVRAHLVGDMVVVRSGGILTPTEARLMATEEGQRLIKSARHELWGINHSEIEGVVACIVGSAVVRSFYDVDVGGAEQVEIYILAHDVEQRLARQERDR